MPDYIAIIILVGGLSIFAASLLQIRAYYRYKKVSRGFIWDPDPRDRRTDITNRVEAAVELIKAMDDGELKGALEPHRHRPGRPTQHLRLIHRLSQRPEQQQPQR